MKENNIRQLLCSLEPISLTEMDGVKLLDRMDTKYVIPMNCLPKVFQHLKNNYSVLEIEGRRAFSYLTTYFDTEDYQFYYDHHNRLAGRIKARSRSYIESDLHFFEIKVKNNYRTKKYREQLNKEHETLTDNQRKKIGSLYTKIRPFYHKDLTYTLAPTLMNTYTRITLVNKGKTERCTIDLDLTFKSPDAHETEMALEDIAIVELKQSKSLTTQGIASALRKMHVHPTSISKYILGLIHIHPEIKHNSFKPLLLNLKKLAHQ